MFKENVYGHKKRLSFIIQSIKNYLEINSLKKNEIKVLDVGCGTGQLITKPISDQKIKILGTDLDKEAIRIAKENINSIYCKLQTISLELLKDKYDIIICAEVLEHLKKPDKLLKVINKKLNHNGYCIVTVPNGYGGFEIDTFFWKLFQLDRIFNRQPKNLKEENQIKKEKQKRSFCEDSPHIQHFTLNKIIEIFKKANFEVLNKKGGVPFSGKIINTLFRNNKSFIKFNLFLGNHLPLQLLSGWYFVLIKKR